MSRVRELTFNVDTLSDVDLSGVNTTLRHLSTKKRPVEPRHIVDFSAISRPDDRTVILRVTLDEGIFVADTTSPRNGKNFITGHAPEVATVVMSNALDPNLNGTVKFDGSTVPSAQVTLDGQHVLKIDLATAFPSTYNAVGGHTIEVSGFADIEGNPQTQDEMIGYAIDPLASSIDTGDVIPYTANLKTGILRCSRLVMERGANIEEQLTRYLRQRGMDREHILHQSLVTTNQATLELYVLYLESVNPRLLKSFPNQGSTLSLSNPPTTYFFTFSAPLSLQCIQNNQAVLYDGTYVGDANVSLTPDEQTLVVDISGLAGANTAGLHSFELTDLCGVDGVNFTSVPTYIDVTVAEVPDADATAGGGASNAFGTVDADGTNLVAVGSDTLVLDGGNGFTVTGDAGTNTATLAVDTNITDHVADTSGNPHQISLEDARVQGDALTAQITIAASPTLSTHAATKGYVDSEISAIPAPPTADSDLSNDQYVTGVNGVNGPGSVTIDPDDLDDTATTNKFVTAAEKTDISTALQPGDQITELNNNANYVTTSGVTSVNGDSAAAVSIGIAELDDNLSPTTSGQIIEWNGTAWVIAGAKQPAGVQVSTDVTLTGTPDYITISGQTITRNQIDLATDVTGLLPYSSVSGTPSLATVATSGAYADLTGTPSLATVATSGAYSDLSGLPSLAAVATSGAYSDLTGTPSIPVSIDDLNDATISGTPTAVQVLKWDGTSAFINAQLAYSDISGTPSLATVATSGAYSDLSGTPTLATVATSGAYSDLSGTPSLAAVATSGAYADLSGTPTLATVATSGSYNDLSNKPTIPADLDDLGDVTITTGTLSAVQVLKYDGSSAFVNDQLTYSDIANTPSLAAVATSGNYSDLSGTPSLATVATSGAYADLSGTPTLATVATSGSYNDLSNKPTIPADLDDLSDVAITTGTLSSVQVLKWDGSSAFVNTQLTYSDIANTPSLATVATSGAYGDLSGTPTLATVATSGAYGDLSGTPSLATVATTGAYGDLSGTPTIPTQASLNVDDLIDLSGVAEGATDLGTFSGGTIDDNRTVKLALQDLETEVEQKIDTNANLTGINQGLATTDSPEFTGLTIDHGTASTPAITVTSTLDDSTAAPEFEFHRNSASPADGDYLGQVKFAGENSTGGKKNYAKITGKISDVTAGTEDGLIEYAVQKDGSLVIVARQTHDALKLINGTSLEVAGTATVTGNIITSGTVDGRDLATDGTKLDAINQGLATTDSPDFTGLTVGGTNVALSTDLGTAAALDVPASGDASTSQVVKGDDTRLHPKVTAGFALGANVSYISFNENTQVFTLDEVDLASSDVTGLLPQANVNGLSTSLAGKSDTTHNHNIDALANVTTTSTQGYDFIALRADKSGWENFGIDEVLSGKFNTAAATSNKVLQWNDTSGAWELIDTPASETSTDAIEAQGFFFG